MDMVKFTRNSNYELSKYLDYQNKTSAYHKLQHFVIYAIMAIVQSINDKNIAKPGTNCKRISKWCFRNFTASL
jgi:hypothetical protein